MEPVRVKRLRYEKLVLYTDNFSERNYIGPFQFGKLYHGRMVFSLLTKHLLVKIWEVPEKYNCSPVDNHIRLMEETRLLSHEMLINHPGLVQIYGYCCEGGNLCVAYEFQPLDSVFNLIPKEGFSWLKRIKVVLGLASLLRYLHAGKSSSAYKPFIVHNLAAEHVVLDEDYNPKLCDFGSTRGGIFPNKRTYSGHDILGCYGCTDISVFNTGHWSNKQDVFAFGVILLSLISKRVCTDQDRLYEWAVAEYEAFVADSDIKHTEFSLVHQSLEAERGFCRADGHQITMLALGCVNGVEHDRPTMKQVDRSLLELEVAKQYSDFLGVKVSSE